MKIIYDQNPHKNKKTTPIITQIIFPHHILGYIVKFYNLQGNRSNIINANGKNLSKPLKILVDKNYVKGISNITEAVEILNME